MEEEPGEETASPTAPQKEAPSKPLPAAAAEKEDAEVNSDIDDSPAERYITITKGSTDDTGKSSTLKEVRVELSEFTLPSSPRQGRSCAEGGA